MGPPPYTHPGRQVLKSALPDSLNLLGIGLVGLAFCVADRRLLDSRSYLSSPVDGAAPPENLKASIPSPEVPVSYLGQFPLSAAQAGL